jgi:hypothetical protein
MKLAQMNKQTHTSDVDTSADEQANTHLWRGYFLASRFGVGTTLVADSVSLSARVHVLTDSPTLVAAFLVGDS